MKDAKTINSAYKDTVKLLFNVLWLAQACPPTTSIPADGLTPEERFATGLANARSARKIAFKILADNQ